MTEARWTKLTDGALIGATVVFLAAYAAPIIWPNLPRGSQAVCEVVANAMWALFGVDYVVRFVLADGKAAFVRKNLLDLAVLVLPFLRPLRLLRLVAVLSVLNRASARSLRGRVAAYTVGGAVLLLVVASLAVTDAERGHAGANIDGIGDGIWWAITTMTTVGYGDQFPTTTTGRCIAVTLMIGGVAILGVVTGTVASWLVERVEEATAGTDATQALLVELAENVAQLTDQVRELSEWRRPAALPLRGDASRASPLNCHHEV